MALGRGFGLSREGFKQSSTSSRAEFYNQTCNAKLIVKDVKFHANIRLTAYRSARSDSKKAVHPVLCCMMSDAFCSSATTGKVAKGGRQQRIRLHSTSLTSLRSAQRIFTSTCCSRNLFVPTSRADVDKTFRQSHC